MKGKIVAVVVFVLVAAGVYAFGFYLPHERLVSELTKECEITRQEYSVFVRGLAEGKGVACDRLQTKLLRIMCDAYHSNDPAVCDGHWDCMAVARKELEACHGMECRAIIAQDVSVCADVREEVRPRCENLALRNDAFFKPGNCEELRQVL